jgi:hypothetical protein
MAVTTFTTWDQVARRLSATAIELRVDHSPDDGFQEANEWASLYVLGFLGGRYSPATLASSNYVASITADICIWYLDTFRNNPVSGTADARKEMWDKILQMIQTNKMNVPDVSNAADRPQVLGQRVDNTRNPQLRTTDAGSTRYRPEGVNLFPDVTEPPLR